MKFDFLDKDLWPIARQIVSFLKKRGYRDFAFEKSLGGGYQFSPTIIAKKRYEVQAIEIKICPSYHDHYDAYIKDCFSKRENVKNYLAFPRYNNEVEIAYTQSFMDKIKEYGIGIYMVDGRDVTVTQDSVKCFMMISKKEFRIASVHKHLIDPIIDKYNAGQFIDAIRDITELVEGVVVKLAIEAARKSRIVPGIKEIKSKDFNGIIQILSAPAWGGEKQKRYFDEPLKYDLLSYKGTRNLSHHPRDREEEHRLEEQLLERIRMGIRLVNDVYKIRI